MKFFLRWNVFDTMSIALAIYAIICVQILNYLVASGLTINNVFVQFFTNQTQVWTFVSISYLISRISMTIKSIKVRWGGHIERSEERRVGKECRSQCGGVY